MTGFSKSWWRDGDHIRHWIGDGGGGRGSDSVPSLDFLLQETVLFYVPHPPHPSNTHTHTHSHTQVLNFVFNGNILVGTAVMD